MKHTAQDILNYVEDNDVKFVRLAFCDIFGNQKNISVFAGDLPYAFEQGVCFDEEHLPDGRVRRSDQDRNAEPLRS